MVLVKLVIHLPLVGRYGYFRDELYFLDLGRHLDWGYVDCAPLIGVIAKLALLLGARCRYCARSRRSRAPGSWCWRLLVARELGGGRAAQALTGCAVIAIPWSSP